MATVECINGIPTRILARTGVRVTVLGLGGADLARERDVQLCVRIIRTAIDEGVNFLDNAWCYHDGESERYMGLALRDGYRDKAFLMTKNHGRDAAMFQSQLHDSLRRLQTDCIDLLQFHQIETFAKETPDGRTLWGICDCRPEKQRWSASPVVSPDSGRVALKGAWCRGWRRFVRGARDDRVSRGIW